MYDITGNQGLHPARSPETLGERQDRTGTTRKRTSRLAREIGKSINAIDCMHRGINRHNRAARGRIDTLNATLGKPIEEVKKARKSRDPKALENLTGLAKQIQLAFAPLAGIGRDIKATLIQEMRID